MKDEVPIAVVLYGDAQPSTIKGYCFSNQHGGLRNLNVKFSGSRNYTINLYKLKTAIDDQVLFANICKQLLRLNHAFNWRD